MKEEEMKVNLFFIRNRINQISDFIFSGRNMEAAYKLGVLYKIVDNIATKLEEDEEEGCDFSSDY